jgi:hypothetical protein
MARRRIYSVEEANSFRVSSGYYKYSVGYWGGSEI